MKSRAKKIAFSLALLYVGLLSMLMLLERFLVYPAPSKTQGDWNAQSYGAQDVSFQSADGTKLHGWYFEHPTPRAHVLFCHGNGEHVGYLGQEMLEMAEHFRISIFAFDYRGYGKSEGKPFEQGVIEDSIAAQQWLADQANIKPTDIVLHGRSLGGGVAVNLAGNVGARALIAERTFHSMVAIGAGQYPFLPVRWVMRNRYPSVEHIQKFDGTLLQLHGDADTLVPIESAEQLFAACPSVKKSFIKVPGMGHGDSTPSEFYAAIESMLESLQTSD